MAQFEKFLSETMPKIRRLSVLAEDSTLVDDTFYQMYDVKRGLRDINGTGVLAGLTDISDIVAFEELPDGSGKFKHDENGKRIPAPGHLRYRGIEIEDIVKGFITDNRFGFEEVAYLLLFGALPSVRELEDFRQILNGFRSLPVSFVRDVIMKAPSQDMMNGLSRSVLYLYSYDDNPDDISIPNVLRQCLQLISQFPLLSVYSYQVHEYYHRPSSLIIHKPAHELSTAENILMMMRDDGKYSDIEARVLDLMLVLHAEHGGGNNSTFSTHVLTSSGTDTYSVMAASLGSLKGPRHGGANIKVAQMMDDMKLHLKERSDAAIKKYLVDILDKKAFDKQGLIYGMGHAVYTVSDPRAQIIRNYVEKLAIAKHMESEYELYARVEKLAPEVIADKRSIYKGVCPNIDFYSGLVYTMLGIPPEMFTPMFAAARIVGWSAHRIEELVNKGKIIRPNYKCVSKRSEYVELKKRK